MDFSRLQFNQFSLNYSWFKFQTLVNEILNMADF